MSLNFTSSISKQYPAESLFAHQTISHLDEVKVANRSVSLIGSIKQRWPHNSTHAELQSIQPRPTLYDFSASVRKQLQMKDENPNIANKLPPPVGQDCHDTAAAASNSNFESSSISVAQRTSKHTPIDAYRAMYSPHGRRGPIPDFSATQNTTRRQSLPVNFDERQQYLKYPQNDSNSKFRRYHGASPIEQQRSPLRQSYRVAEGDCNESLSQKNVMLHNRPPLVVPLEQKKGGFSGFVSQLSSHLGRPKLRDLNQRPNQLDSQIKNGKTVSDNDRRSKFLFNGGSDAPSENDARFYKDTDYIFDEQHGGSKLSDDNILQVKS